MKTTPDEHLSSAEKGSRSPSMHPFANVSDKKKLGVLSLTVLIFYEVCGGPFGVEDIVRAGGPLIALVGFSLVLVWAVPEALITAELSSAMPEDSGSVAWVDAAYGSFWAFQKGWLGWLSGVADNALYPILFLDCLVALLVRDTTADAAADEGLFDASSDADSRAVQWIRMMGSDEAAGGVPEVRWAVIFCITMTLTYLTFRGLDVVGNVAIFICCLSMLPFVIFCLVGLPQVNPSKWLVTPPGGLRGVDWKLLLNTFFWNINFWESASSFSAEVSDPGRTFPKGMFWAIVLVFTSLFLPVLIGTGAASLPYTEWTDGSFVTVAKQIGGPWLALSFMASSVLTNVGSFNAEMTSDAWQVAGMAERGMLPSVLAQRNRYDTPTYGILLSMLGVLGVCSLSFTDVIDITNMLYCFGQLIEFAAFLELRRSKPDLARPFKVPLGLTGMTVMLAFPVAFIFIILYFSGIKIIILSVVMGLMGVPLKFYLDKAKAEKRWEFNDNLANPSTVRSADHGPNGGAPILPLVPLVGLLTGRRTAEEQQSLLRSGTAGEGGGHYKSVSTLAHS